MKHILRIAILAIALFVTYASVFGLGMLFKSVMYPVMAAGVALELGKYVAVTFTHRNWKKLNWFEHVAMALFLVVLMTFTSAGVFSYLGQGYQASFAERSKRTEQIALLDSEIKQGEARITAIDAEMARVPDTVVRSRIALIQELNKEKEPLTAKVNTLKTERAKLNSEALDAAVHAGPIEYLARVAKVEVERAASWVIIALTLCLDPFALFMTILLNKIIMIEKEEAMTLAIEEKPKHVELPEEPEIHDTDNAYAAATVDAVLSQWTRSKTVDTESHNAYAEATETDHKPDVITPMASSILAEYRGAEQSVPDESVLEQGAAVLAAQDAITAELEAQEQAQEQAKVQPQIEVAFLNPGLKRVNSDGTVQET